MGLKTVSNDHGTEILKAIAQNDFATLKAIMDKRLKSDSKKMRELFESNIEHKPTKTFACPLVLAVRLRDPAILRCVYKNLFVRSAVKDISSHN
jgi:hypothetical protein